MYNEIDCNMYNLSSCPKGISLNEIELKDKNLNILFVGCWGVYCKNGEQKTIKYKKGIFEESNSNFGSKSVVNGMIDYSKINKINAVILAGDNIYSRNPNEDEIKYPEKYPNLKEDLYDMDLQFQEGFLNCMSNVNTDAFLLAIGNHDITNCDILNKQLRYKDNGWNLPALYYNTIYNLNNEYKINLIFIDTNLYDKQKSCNKKEYPENIEKRNENHEIWLKEAINKQKEWIKNVITKNKCDWNLIIGHIPYINNPHKKIKDGGNIDYSYNNILANDIKEIKSYVENKGLNIQLYLCADEHNMQFIKCPDEGAYLSNGLDKLPAILIAGSGGTDLDNILPSDSLNECTKFGLKTHGFVSLKINEKILELIFFTSENLKTKISKKINIDLFGKIY